MRLASTLKPRGVLYMSFKLGEEDRVVDRRLFKDQTEATLRLAVGGLPLELSAVWTSSGFRPGRQDEMWVNAVALREGSGGTKGE